MSLREGHSPSTLLVLLNAKEAFQGFRSEMEQIKGHQRGWYILSSNARNCCFQRPDRVFTMKYLYRVMQAVLSLNWKQTLLPILRGFACVDICTAYLQITADLPTKAPPSMMEWLQPSPSLYCQSPLTTSLGFLPGQVSLFILIGQV